eukprot:gene3357-90_t
MLELDQMPRNPTPNPRVQPVDSHLVAKVGVVYFDQRGAGFYEPKARMPSPGRRTECLGCDFPQQAVKNIEKTFGMKSKKQDTVRVIVYNMADQYYLDVKLQKDLHKAPPLGESLHLTVPLIRYPLCYGAYEQSLLTQNPHNTRFAQPPAGPANSKNNKRTPHKVTLIGKVVHRDDQPNRLSLILDDGTEPCLCPVPHLHAFDSLFPVPPPSIQLMYNVS